MLEAQLKQQVQTYKLIDSVTGEHQLKRSKLTATEAWYKNYGYALNGSRLRWKLED